MLKPSVMSTLLICLTVVSAMVAQAAALNMSSVPSSLFMQQLNNETLLSRFSSLYQIAHNEVDDMLLPSAPDDTFDLSSYTPFCSAVSAASSQGPPPPKVSKNKKKVDIECLRWEEQELDMLMMYMDLLAVGMKKSLARQFYKQIRCLSRSNTVMNPDKLTWDVCFKYDYSKHVGVLLSHYIKQDAILKSPVENELKNEKIKKSVRFNNNNNNIKQLLTMRPLKSSARNLYVSDTVVPTDYNRGLYLLLAFAKSNAFRLFTSNNLLHFLTEQTSCCDECVDDNYFVNIEQDQCLLNPFGKHCCHKACKSLARLRVGASSSISFCCEKSSPSVCKKP